MWAPLTTLLIGYTKHEACQERSQRSPPKIRRVISDLSDFTFHIANNKRANQTGPVFHRFKRFAIILMRERERERERELVL